MIKDILLKPNERLDDLQFNNLYIIQNSKHYCFTSDAINLANFAKAKKNDVVVDLCSGSGVIGILLQAKTNAKKVILVEVQDELANMSKRSVQHNNLQSKVEVINEKLQNINKQIGCELYDVVVCNPPYKMANSSIKNENKEIAICRHEITVTLEEVVKETCKLLKYGGRFYTINKEERLSDLICLGRKYNLEPKVLKINESKKGASTIMIEFIKGGKPGMIIKK